MTDMILAAIQLANESYANGHAEGLLEGKRQAYAEIRQLLERQDPYVGAGSRGAGLAQSDAESAPVYAYRDALLDKLDESSPPAHDGDQS